MKFLKKEYICPYCFETNSLENILFRCKNDPRKCVLENDEAYAHFLGVTDKKMAKFFVPPLPQGRVEKLIKIPKEAKCPQCSEITRARICESCHSELPYTIGDYKDLILGVIGAKEAGKSHYISVLINTIKNEVGSNFNCNLQALNDETIHRYRNDFYNPVFRQKKVIQATRSARTDRNVRLPLIYTLAFMGKNIFLREKIRNIATISFFDTAGEDLDSEDTIRTENKYIFNSSGIILLLDPLQLPYIRDELRGKVALPDQNTEINDILDRTANLIRAAKKIKLDKRIDIPIAVAFSKCDALNDLLPQDSCLNYPTKHNGSFDKGDFEDVNSEMESLISAWSGDFLLNQLKLNFKRYAFFGLSALGCNPHGNHKINAIRPTRVADPFLWLLWRHKLIKSEERNP